MNLRAPVLRAGAPGTILLFLLMLTGSVCLAAPRGTGALARETQSGTGALARETWTGSAVPARAAEASATAPETDKEAPGHGTVELSGAFGSLEALGRGFVEVLSRGDQKELEGMTLTRSEFEQLVYPELPAGRPGSNVTAEFLWGQTQLKSRAGLLKTMSKAGKKFEFCGIRFEKGERKYRHFTIHGDSRLQLKDAEGVVREYQLFGSVIEADGRFKIYSYVQ